METFDLHQSLPNSIYGFFDDVTDQFRPFTDQGWGPDSGRIIEAWETFNDLLRIVFEQAAYCVTRDSDHQFKPLTSEDSLNKQRELIKWGHKLFQHWLEPPSEKILALFGQAVIAVADGFICELIKQDTEEGVDPSVVFFANAIEQIFFKWVDTAIENKTSLQELPDAIRAIVILWAEVREWIEPPCPWQA